MIACSDVVLWCKTTGGSIHPTKCLPKEKDIERQLALSEERTIGEEA